MAKNDITIRLDEESMDAIKKLSKLLYELKDIVKQLEGLKNDLGQIHQQNNRL